MDGNEVITIIISVVNLLVLLLWAVGFITIFATAKNKSMSTAGYVMEKIVDIVRLIFNIIGSLFILLLFITCLIAFSGGDLGSYEVQMVVAGVKMMGYDVYVYIILIVLLVYAILTTIMYAKMVGNYNVMIDLVRGIKPRKTISGYAIVMQVVNIVMIVLMGVVMIIAFVKLNDEMIYFGQDSTAYIVGFSVGYFIVAFVMNIMPSICEIMLMNGVKKRMQFFKI